MLRAPVPDWIQSKSVLFAKGFHLGAKESVICFSVPPFLCFFKVFVGVAFFPCSYQMKIQLSVFKLKNYSDSEDNWEKKKKAIGKKILPKCHTDQNLFFSY